MPLLRRLGLFYTVLASMEFVLLNGALLPGYIELKIDIIPANVSQGAAVIHIVQRDSLGRGTDLSTNIQQKVVKPEGTHVESHE